MEITGENEKEQELFRNDWKRVSDFLYQRTREINRHENGIRNEQRQKGSEYALPNIDAFFRQIAINQYFSFDCEKGVSIHALPTPLFNRVIEEDFRQILLEDKLAFATDNPYSIIETLRLKFPNADFFSMESYTEALRDDAYCFFIKEENNVFEPSIFKLDLFRHIREDKKESKQNGHALYEFVGGYFHILKHFALWGTQFTSKSSSILIRSPWELPNTLALIYFNNLGHTPFYGNVMELRHHMYNHDWSLAFYLEQTTNVAYLKTCHIKKSK